MEVIEKSLDTLVKLLLNFRKNPNRTCSEKHLVKVNSEIDAVIKNYEEAYQSLSLFYKVSAKNRVLECESLAKELRIIIQRQRPKECAEEAIVPKLSGVADHTERGEAETSGNQVYTAKGETPEIIDKQKTMASFSDIEGALEKFEGRNKPVAAWFTAFEDVATACDFSAVQKYLYCRRLLTGAARLAVESETDVGNFDKLKTYLVQTFTEEVKISDIYKELASTRKMSNESSEQYAFRMKRIAGGQTIDGPSMVDFIVTGLPGSPLEKAGLMEATTFETLRAKLPAYDKLQAAIGSARSRASIGRAEGGKPFLPSPRVDATVCFTCGKPGHKSNNCFSKVKCEKCQKVGHNANNCRYIKCFKCGLEGHTQPNCPKNQA